MSDKTEKAIVKHQKVTELSKDEQKKLKLITSQLTRLLLQNGKAIGIWITFDHKGVPELLYFGSDPEMNARAKYMADVAYDAIIEGMKNFAMPDIIDVPDKDALA